MRVVIILVCGLAACGPDLDAMNQVDFAADKDFMIAHIEKHGGIGARFADGTGRWINKDGSAFWHIPKLSRDGGVWTEVMSMTTEKICFAESGNWGGGCVSVFRKDGEFACKVDWANGKTRTGACEIMSSRW